MNHLRDCGILCQAVKIAKYNIFFKLGMILDAPKLATAVVTDCFFSQLAGFRCTTTCRAAGKKRRQACRSYCICTFKTPEHPSPVGSSSGAPGTDVRSARSLALGEKVAPMAWHRRHR